MSQPGQQSPTETSPRASYNGAFGSPSLERIDLNQPRPKATFDEPIGEVPSSPNIHHIGSKVRLLAEDNDESDIESPSTGRKAASGGTRSPKGRQLGTVDQVSRMQMQSIYRFLNPSGQAVAREMKSDLPAKPSPSVIGSIRGRKRTIPRMKTGNKTITKADVETIVDKVQARYGFQLDSGRNVCDYILFLLDSRTSRIGDTDMAIVSLHADYVGGETSNYKTWYFNTFAKEELQQDVKNAKELESELLMEGYSEKEARETLYNETWKKKMRSLSPRKMLQQVALWLLIWGESANMRLAPELLCFIFKMALDGLRGNPRKEQEPGWFLDNVVKKIYDFYHSEVKKLAHRHDAGSVVGYDDLNEFFRSTDKIRQLETRSGLRIWAEAPEKRLDVFGKIDFARHIKKTFYESRTWFHMVVNYNRILVLHLVTFLWYLVIATPFLFYGGTTLSNPPPFPVLAGLFAMMSVVGHGVSILGTLGELAFFPFSFSRAQRAVLRTLVTLLMAGLVFSGSYVAITSHVGDREVTAGSYFVGLLAAFGAILSTLWILVFPVGITSARIGWNQVRDEQDNAPFMFNFPAISWERRASSLGFWIATYGVKFVASFYYVALVQAKPMESLWRYATTCAEAPDSSPYCELFGWMTVGAFALLLFCLHFLDTYIWYNISLTVCGFWVNLRRGVTLWAPWREAFSRLPKRIFANLVASSFFTDTDNKRVGIRNRSFACAEIWNSIVISMYNNHLLSAKEMTKLLYEVSQSADGNTVEVNEPRYFIAQEDSGAQTAGLWGSGDGYQPEVSRRLSFFAHSIAMSMPEPSPVQNMPTFTVLVPHYAERMLLTLAELIKVSDTTSDITLLEYLKFLYPREWANFVQESQLLETDDGPDEGSQREKGAGQRLEADMMNAVGFKRVDPKYVMRTRIWASLRTQTLYRTIDGFFNYYKALKVLYRAECFDEDVDDEEFESDAHAMASRKFRFLVAMQRYQKFTAEEKEAVNTLFEIFPDVQIAYVEEARGEDGSVDYYSALVDGHCLLNEKGSRVPRFRVKLPGWPILGDGKSDNQNHAIIFSRGEFLQVIDANQEHYIEECFKIRNLLGEFEYDNGPYRNPYLSAKSRPNSLNRQADFEQQEEKGPVAIVGTREHVFSNGVGVMADVTAGKEFVFGTLIQRMLSILGGRLHYGHPDFLNAVWLYPRGGVSKAQKSLNLNEDIFAGMNSSMRGGRIKYTEYIQCGKGRDLGFTSVMNFITKLALGVGEQTLTREHYVYGTKLSIDRFFTFFFGHIGFFIQQAAAILGVLLYAMVAVMATTLDAHTRMKCRKQNIDGSFCALVGRWEPEIISAWLTNTFFAVMVAMVLTQLPLLLQLLTENGLVDAISRVFCQIISFSPVIESFTSVTYAQTMVENIKYGGATYIATGRSVATSRAPFSSLYARFSGNGVQVGLTLLTATIALIVNGLTTGLGFPIFSLLFGSVGLALTLAPWFFNFHQFDLREYILDYPETLSFFFSGHGIPNPKPTWSQMIWQRRKRLTARPDRWDWMSYLRVNWIENMGFSALMILLYTLLYTFSLSFSLSLQPRNENFIQSIKELGILSGAMTAINLGISLVLGAVALISGFVSKSGSAGKEYKGEIIARIGYALSLLVFLSMVYVLWLVDDVQFLNTLFAVRAMIEIQRLQYLLLCAVLPADLPRMVTHSAFWSGDWSNSSIWRFVPEVLLKTHEMFLFAVDFLVAHLLLLLLLPFCFVPVIDQIHAFMILWVRPRFMTWNRKLKQNAALRLKRTIWPAAWRYGLFFTAFAVLLTGFILPIVMGTQFSPIVQSIKGLFGMF